MGLLAAGAAVAQDRPNVILLVADDLGYGDLECYGAKNVHTPNANRVAAEGVRFTQMHCTASTSTPSRYSLLTGQYAWRKPNTKVLPGNAAMIIDPEQYTIADLFHDAGYATGAFGKWHLGLGNKAGEQNWNGKITGTPSAIGFDYHYIQAATADRVPCVYLEQDTVANYDASAPIQVSYSANFEGEPTGVTHRSSLKLDWSHGHNQSIVDGISRIGYMKGGGKALWKDENIADSIADHSRRFIMEHKNEPFFMYLCTNDVHVPRWPHERFRGKNPMGLRGDAIDSFDWTVGQVLQALEDAGVADNTLLIITSDNGPVLDDGYVDYAFEKLNGHTPTDGRRGDKYSNYEGGTSVPFIVRWPKRVAPQAEENATLLSHIDIFASMGALLGSTLPADAAPDSGDMLAQILGESKEHRPWVSQLGERYTMSIRTPRYKYIPSSAYGSTLGWEATGHDGKAIDVGDSSKPQVYDLENDPNETTNIAPSNPELVKQLEQIWKDAADISYEEPVYSTPGNEHWYTISTPLRDGRYLCSSDSMTVVGGSYADHNFASSHWKFELRQDAMLNIVNRAEGKYLDPNSASVVNKELRLSDTEPTAGWKIDYAETSGYVVIYATSPLVQLNQTTAANAYKVVNWGNGMHGDSGCQFLLTEVGDPIAAIEMPTALSEPLPYTAEDPHYFAIKSVRAAGYVTATPKGLYGADSPYIVPENTWKFIKRDDSGYDILNQATHQYILPQKIEGKDQLAMGDAPGAKGWRFSKISGKIYRIYCGTVQFNQTTSANSYKIFDWGGGSNTSDEGCKFKFIELTSALSGLSSIVQAPDDTGLYDLHGRQVRGNRHGVFIRAGRKVIL